MADQDDKQAAQRLAEAGRAGYQAYPDDYSHSVWFMMNQMGMNEQYRTANQMIAHMEASGSGWHEISIEDAAALANKGKVAIAGLAKPGGSGHVVMIMPGPLQPSGGFSGVRSSGVYPPSASGAASSWPGAHSRGEKTVRDPWTARDFPSVRFWTRD